MRVFSKIVYRSNLVYFDANRGLGGHSMLMFDIRWWKQLIVMNKVFLKKPIMKESLKSAGQISY